MVLTESNMLELGSPCPSFALPNVDGTTVSLADMAGKPLVVMFICNHCPYVKHIAPELAKLGKDYAEREIEIVAIQSNDIVEYPDDGPEQMKAESAERGYTFPCWTRHRKWPSRLTRPARLTFFSSTRAIN